MCWKARLALWQNRINGGKGAMMNIFGTTRMQFRFACLVALGLSACSPPIPNSNPAGVGFQDYPTYLRQREAALNGGPLPPVVPYGTQPPGGFSADRIGSAIDAASGGAVVPAQQQPGNQLGGGVGAVIGADNFGQPLAATTPPLGGQGGTLDPNRARGDAPTGILSDSGEVNPNNTGISDEQEFSAVTSRETIASDAERIARNRAQYEVIQPGALPERAGSSAAPNIVAFAMSTNHAPGTQVYSRSGLSLSNPQKACARYGSPDLAQEAFLAAGGPERDRKGIDPDGDGYACSWDPRPFRAN
jgi:hypothetical protein